MNNVCTTSGGSQIMLHQPCLEAEPQSLVIVLDWTFSYIEILPKISVSWSASAGGWGGGGESRGAIKFVRHASCDEHNNPIL